MNIQWLKLWSMKVITTHSIMLDGQQRTLLQNISFQPRLSVILLPQIQLFAPNSNENNWICQNSFIGHFQEKICNKTLTFFNTLLLNIYTFQNLYFHIKKEFIKTFAVFVGTNPMGLIFIQVFDLYTPTFHFFKELVWLQAMLWSLLEFHLVVSSPVTYI